jgi:hypothetical protein
LLGQIKNNLTAKVMITHRYHMETEIVGYDTEAQKDIKASKVFIHGLIAQNVEDIVLEQEKAKTSARTQGGQALSWLVGFLTDKSEVPSNQVVSAGGEAGHSRSAIYRAKDKLGDRLLIANTPTVPKESTWRLVKGGEDAP